MDVLSTLQAVLLDADFKTHLTSINRQPVVCFEDEALMGFGCSFSNPDSLLANWRSTEMAMLTRYAPKFRAAVDKAWNVYSVFLCGPVAEPAQARSVRRIEEDLERTRKVASCGVASRDDLVKVLLPVLPLQYVPALRIEDPTHRLQHRIQTIAPKAAAVALDNSVPPVEVVRLLGASS